MTLFSFAREIHHRSSRQDTLMIKVNCASIPKDLFESEFFGHAKGTFAGAVVDRIGWFGEADGGTLFLDELGEIPVEHQSKLLRFLQEGEYERVGEHRTRKIDVRISAATNRNLQEEVKKHAVSGRFVFSPQCFPHPGASFKKTVLTEVEMVALQEEKQISLSKSCQILWVSR